MEEIWEIDLERKYVSTNIPIDSNMIGIGFMWWNKILKEKIMLKCKYNEDCSKYPACGHTCGLNLEELLWHKCHQIRDLEFRMKQANFQITQIQRACLQARKELDKEDYIPTCPYGYIDCISDPAYIRAYHPKWWEELGMPIECSNAKEYKEDCSCQWYDDEDK